MLGFRFILVVQNLCFNDKTSYYINNIKLQNCSLWVSKQYIMCGRIIYTDASKLYFKFRSRLKCTISISIKLITCVHLKINYSLLGPEKRHLNPKHNWGRICVKNATTWHCEVPKLFLTKIACPCSQLIKKKVGVTRFSSSYNILSLRYKPAIRPLSQGPFLSGFGLLAN